jgi:ATP-binding cassette subfamily B protein
VPPGIHGEALPADSARDRESEGFFVKRAARIRRVPFIRQLDETDCGVACLAMVCRHFGRAVSLARIRQMSHASAQGTSLKAICQTGTALGLAVRAVKAPAGTVARMPLPAILHWEGNHWVLLYEADDRYARVADPAVGLRRIPRSELDASWSGYAALFDYTTALEDTPVGGAGFGWLSAFVRPHLRHVGRAVVLAVMVSVLEVCFPVFTQLVVDRAIVDSDLGLLHTLVIGMTAIVATTALATLVQRYLLSFVAVRFDASTLDHLTQRLLRLPLGYFVARRTGDIQRRLAGMRQVRQFVVQSGVLGLTAAAELAMALVLMFVYSPRLAGVFLLTTPLYALLMRFSSRRLGPIYDGLESAFGKYTSQQIDAIRGIETVKAMGSEAALRSRMALQWNGMARRQFNADFTLMGYDGVIRAVMFLSTALFLWIGAREVMEGRLSIGGLVAYGSLVAMANGPMAVGLHIWDELQYVEVLLNRLRDVLEPEPEQGEDHGHLLPVRSLGGRISLEGVSFQFGGPTSPKILDGITLDVPAGARVAIVGRSGSGKTTLVKCLAGLYEPTLGTIRYDGVDMKKLDYHELRRQIGVVLQDDYLFDDTIAGNIAFGDDEPDPERVAAAARAANADGFIERLPLGYETRIGESGLLLSGGQRQRVAIARALYHAPAVLLFDEATSSLDTESERAVRANIDRLLGGRTSFVIAHRLSTIRGADLIVVLEAGKIAEQGTHAELMRARGLYHHLSTEQLGC